MPEFDPDELAEYYSKCLGALDVAEAKVHLVMELLAAAHVERLAASREFENAQALYYAAKGEKAAKE